MYTDVLISINSDPESGNIFPGSRGQKCTRPRTLDLQQRRQVRYGTRTVPVPKVPVPGTEMTGTLPQWWEYWAGCRPPMWARPDTWASGRARRWTCVCWRGNPDGRHHPSPPRPPPPPHCCCCWSRPPGCTASAGGAGWTAPDNQSIRLKKFPNKNL